MCWNNFLGRNQKVILIIFEINITQKVKLRTTTILQQLFLYIIPALASRSIQCVDNFWLNWRQDTSKCNTKREFSLSFITRFSLILLFPYDNFCGWFLSTVPIQAWCIMLVTFFVYSPCILLLFLLLIPQYCFFLSVHVCMYNKLD